MAKRWIVIPVDVGSIPTRRPGFSCDRELFLATSIIMRVLKLDISGIPESWVSLETAAGYYATNTVAYTLGEAMRVLRGGHNVRGEQSRIDVHPIIAVNGKSAADKLLSATPRLTRHNHKLFKRDRYTCAYCGGVFPEHELEREHIVPSSRGGRDTWMNVVSACRPCNQLKGAKKPEEARMPLLYVPYVPSRWEDLILQARREHIVADQMDFLRSNLPRGSRLA
jgi:HNH endonuclease